MSYILTFDVGTTALKCVVLDDQQNVVFSKEKEITTIHNNGFIEQSPQEWYNHFCGLTKEIVLKLNDTDSILGIICSGQMQDLICVDADGESVCNAILYSDQRGESVVSTIDSSVIESIRKKTGNDFNGSMPFAKILWLKENNPDIYEKTYKVLISAKDYITQKLTNSFTSDVTSLSTSGMFDIEKHSFISEVGLLGLNESILPEVAYTDTVVGSVLSKASKETGLPKGCKVYCGIGDAGATTLASGIASPGEININLGTSGWIASISKNIQQNVFNLVSIDRDSFINVVPVYNAGSVHKWIANLVDSSKDKYNIVDRAIEHSSPNPEGLLFLPYLVGERFPVLDSKVRGCFVGVSSETSQNDMVRATLEGVVFSLKQALLTLGINPTKISLIGGGARKSEWNQIFADILGLDIIIYDNSEFLPSMALASSVLLEHMLISSYDDFISSLNLSTSVRVCKPNAKNIEIYNQAYKRFEKIYPSVKDLF